MYDGEGKASLQSYTYVTGCWERPPTTVRKRQRRQTQLDTHHPLQHTVGSGGSRGVHDAWTVYQVDTLHQSHILPHLLTQHNKAHCIGVSVGYMMPGQSTRLIHFICVATVTPDNLTNMLVYMVQTSM